jgi:hypothetical protein
MHEVDIWTHIIGSWFGSSDVAVKWISESKRGTSYKMCENCNQLPAVIKYVTSVINTGLALFMSTKGHGPCSWQPLIFDITSWDERTSSIASVFSRDGNVLKAWSKNRSSQTDTVRSISKHIVKFLATAKGGISAGWDRTRACPFCYATPMLISSRFAESAKAITGSGHC